MAVLHLANLLDEDQIVADMKATDRWGAIVELVDRLVDSGRLSAGARGGVLESLKDREESMSTGIGFGIAIPHASSDQVDEVVAAFGRSLKGIGFDSLDNQPVRFIILFVVPQDQFALHLRALAAIAKFMNERGVRDRLAEAGGVQDILEILRGAAARTA